MTANSWCSHESLNYSLKFKQVQKRISENHSLVWVKYGETFRNATLAEAAAMRKAEPKEPDFTPLGYGLSGEISGCLFKPPVAALAHTRESRRRAKPPGFLFGVKIHLQESSANPQARAIVDELLADACNIQQANRFCLEHASS